MRLRWLAMIPALLCAQTPAELGRVSGTVTNSVTGEPILRAHVTVHCASEESHQPNQENFGALTNAKGDFTVASLPKGNCWVQAERVGFVAETSSNAVKGDARTDGVKLKLTPAGAITGRVSNAAGEPLQHVEVVTETGANNGFTSVSFTDDKGEYRIGGLRPGKYRIKAKPQNLPFPPEIRSDGTVELRDAATYYPASMDAKTAQRVEVRAGAEAGGVDIKLVQTPVIQVSGKVVDIPAGMKGVMVDVSPSGGGSSVKADGTFVIWRMDPGKYMLRAQHYGGPQLTSAPMEIEVTTANVEHLELRLVPPFEVSGQLRFDDEEARQTPKPPTRSDGTAPPAAPPQPRRLTLRALRRGSPMGGTLQLQTLVAPDDSFQFQKAPPDRYRVVPNWGSGFVKSVRAGNTETDGDIIDLRSGPPGPVTLTLSSNVCQISGTVSDANGPVNGVTIQLTLEDDREQVRGVSSNASGYYGFRVPPGKYRIIVSGKDLPVMDDEEAETVELNAGDKITKDLVIGK